MSAKADELMIQCFLRIGRLYGGNTFWQNVKRVLPATIIKITPSKFEKLEYWRFNIDDNITHLSLNEALELADDKICRHLQ